MNRSLRVLSIFVLALAFSSATTAEEQADGVPAHSFNELRKLLIPGEQLIVRDSSGKKTNGRFVTLSANELEITHRRWNFRTEQRTWSEGAVDRIQHKDSTWDGGAIGAAAGVAALVMLVKAPGCDMRCLPFAAVAVQTGMLIGDAIDGSINRTVYEPSRVVSRVHFAPALGVLHPRLVLSYRFSLDH